VAEREAAALESQLAAARSEAGAARRGVLTDPGANDVPYSRQRADELAVHIARSQREIEALAADEEETSARLASEEAHVALLRSATLAAPSSGMVWKLGASDGERVGTGDMAAELVDCSAAFLVAAIPQDEFPNVEIGGEARFRLSGESGRKALPCENAR
jgi:multidrug resistance efflux pump